MSEYHFAGIQDILRADMKKIIIGAMVVSYHKNI